MIRKKVAYPTVATIKPTDFRSVLTMSSIEIAVIAKTVNKTARILNGFLMGKFLLVAMSGRPLLLRR